MKPEVPDSTTHYDGYLVLASAQEQEDGRFAPKVVVRKLGAGSTETLMAYQGDWSDSRREAVQTAKLHGIAWVDEITALGSSTFV